jgi:uncharacterized surface protein with fasciclin (FAS1) repeats
MSKPHPPLTLKVLDFLVIDIGGCVMKKFAALLLAFFLLSFSSAQTILEVAEQDPGLSTFVSALETAGLTDLLSGEGPFTLFAPTNAAFMQLPEAELITLLNNPEMLRQILSYHIVPAFVIAREARELTSAPTLEGSELNLRVEEGNLLINESRVVKFDVGATEDVQASNGVIHVIDSVLVPMGLMLGQATPSLSETPAAPEVAQIYTTVASRSGRYPVNAVGESGVSGSVLVADYGFDTAIVTISLRGTTPDGSHPAHFHLGNCNSNGEIVVPLENVNGATGLSVTSMTAPYDAIVEGDHYLNVHLSGEALNTIVACGEAGLNAN